MLATERHQTMLRAIKLIRVSKRGKRTDQTFVSPEDQDRLMDDLCNRENFVPVATFREINQSGLRTPFEKRKGLYPATRMIENGEADVVVMAFRDRMARNIVVEGTFQGRVGKAGGKIWTHDSGEIKLDTAVERFTSGVLGLMAQMQAEQTAEKTDGPKQRAVMLGIAPFPILPVGYRRHCEIHAGSTDRRSAVYEPERQLVVTAYEMRAARATLEEIRDWLRSQGHVVQIRGVQEMLKKRFYLGELRFGKLVNLCAHEAIIDKAIFDSVQKMRTPRGPRTTDNASIRLLARQGIVRCAHCGRAMTVGSQTKPDGTKHYDYRCSTMGDCTDRVSISADMLEAEVIGYMKQIRRTGQASMGERVAEAQIAVTTTERDMNQSIVNLAVVSDTPKAQEILAEKRAAYDQAVQELQNLQSALGPAHTVSFADWDRADLERKRRLVRIAIKRITISRGKGPERIQLDPFLRG